MRHSFDGVLFRGGFDLVLAVNEILAEPHGARPIRFAEQVTKHSHTAEAPEQYREAVKRLGLFSLMRDQAETRKGLQHVVRPRTA